MEEVFGYLLNSSYVFFLILARMSGIFIASPIFGRRNIPAYFKIGFAFFLSIIVMLSYNFSYTIPQNLIEFVLEVAKEFVVGLVIGFISYMIFSAILLAGQIIDNAIGFGMANVIDPLSEIQVPLLGNFLYLYMLVVFFATDNHHILIRAVVYSYKIVPLGYSSILPQISQKFITFFIELFVIGIEISLPILMSMLVVDIILGILSRAVPQMNVFMVGLPIKIAIGFLVLVIVLPIMNKMIFVLLDKLSIYTYEALRGGFK
ncbi:flagellar biosynthetic protein FliR [Caldicellulosiruptor naganoensis]|uniref:Flagellar biosynthetic protein FliR n=1 Tax=Caldicellulosiruptor naganoensis TaxID=29324 RepID=A0ABY7BM62_9FIRM|nr:flagellar biosynthetic protein FliR [Caldicellulosiruptor naganoensis]WAM32116.1 flagellar biosynthetic protein FliR [Caldicellulosiruptor naganoensis]